MQAKGNVVPLWRRGLDYLLMAALLAVAAASVGVVLLNPGTYQTDFRVFYWSPMSLDGGGNPYDLETKNPNIPEGYSYLYPPLLLHVFKPLSWLSYEAASVVWLAAKLLAFGILLRVWGKYFEPLRLSLFVVAVFVLGFKSAILRDFSAGNISMFEELGLWVAFSLLLAGRPYWGGALIAAIAQVKLIPVILLGLVPLVGPAKSWRAFFVSIGIFVILLLLNFVLMPELTEMYLRSFFLSNPNLVERGEVNPSSLALIQSVVHQLAARGFPLPPKFADYAFFFMVLAGGVTLAIWYARNRHWLTKVDLRLLVYIGCVLDVLVSPRMKDYTFILLLIPALFAIRSSKSGVLSATGFVLLILPSSYSYVPVMKEFDVNLGVLHYYSSLFFAALLLPMLWRMLSVERERVMLGGEEGKMRGDGL